ILSTKKNLRARVESAKLGFSNGPGDVKSPRVRQTRLSARGTSHGILLGCGKGGSRRSWILALMAPWPALRCLRCGPRTMVGYRRHRRRKHDANGQANIRRI